MIKYNLLKSIFIFLALQFLVTQVQAQSLGTIQVETYLVRVSRNSNMPNDYENYYHGSPHTRPDMYYFLNPMSIWNPKNQFVGSGGASFEKFYLNETSWKHAIGNFQVIDKTFYAYNLGGFLYNLEANKFDLSNKRSLRVFMGYSANEDDYGMSPPMNGDDDYRFVGSANDVPFIDFARNGDNFTYKTLTGSADSDGVSYGFRFISRYTIDAIETNLTFLNTKNEPQTIFCKGQKMKLKANYKLPFKNGYFRWEKWINGQWVFIKNGGNVITVDVDPDVYRYRTRLIGDANHYGAGDFRPSLIGSAYSAVNGLTILDKFYSISMDVKDACSIGQDTIGSVEVIHLTGGTLGQNYSVILSSYDETDDEYNQEDERSITGYHPDSLSTYDLFFNVPVGKFKIGIYNNIPTGDLPCGITRGFNVVESTDPIFTASKRDVICHGDNGRIFFNDLQEISNNRSFTLQATSATGTVFTKKIYNQTNGFIDVPFGEYTLQATNDDGCIFDYVGTIEILDKPQLFGSVAPLAGYQLNGITYHGTCAYDRFDAEVTIGGGVPPYTISTSGPFSNYNQTFTLLENETEITIPELFPGTHQFYISDKYGCTIAPLTFVINNPAPINFPQLNLTHPTTFCGGVNPDGSVVQIGNASGGVPPYQYLVDDVEVASFDTTGLGNNSNQIKIIDSLGCVARSFITLENNTFLNVQDDGELPEIIPCDGSITYNIEVTGGIPDLYDGYIVTLNGIPCSLNPDCESSTLFFYAGQPAYYVITVDSTDLQTIEVEDYSGTGCKVSISHQFDQVQPLEITGVSAIPPSCSDGIYHSTFYVKNLPESPYGGYEGFQYVLDGVIGYPSLVTIDGTPATDPLLPLQFTIPVSGAGLHQILITDDFGCGNGIPYEFTLAPVGAFNFSLTSSENLICHNDTTGAFSFQLDGDTPYAVEIFKDGNRIDSITLNSNIHRVNHLMDGTYTVEVTDYKGCTANSSNIIITNPAPIQAMVNSSSAINCTGENGVVEVSNLSGGTAPYEFSLNGQPFQTITTLNGGFEENEILIKDADNCYSEVSLTIPLAGPTLFSSTTALLPASDCGLGATIIELQPGFTFPLEIDLIADPNDYITSELINYGDSLATEIYKDTISDLSAGVYYYLIQDGLGCELVDSFTVGTAVPLIASVTAVMEETCQDQSKDGTITINASGGTPPYMMTLEGVEHITATDTTVITDTVIFTNNYTVDSLSVGVYSFEVRDASGCMFNLTDSIEAGSLPLLNYVVSNYAGCALENLTAEVEIHGYNGNGNYTYSWEDGNVDSVRVGLSPNDYYVTITDATGCTNIGIAYVYDLDSLNMTVDSIVDVTCQADSTGKIQLTTMGGFPPYQFSIDGGNNYQTDSLFTGLGFGTHEFFVKDSHDCLDTTSATITFTNPLNATVATTDETCTASDDGTLKITVIGGVSPFSYSLNNIDFQPQNEFTGLAAGTYIAWVQDGSGCKAVFYNNIVTEPAVLSLTTSLVADEACNQMNGSASGSASGGTPPYIFEWDGNISLNDSLLENAAAGVHTLKVTDDNGCVETSMVTIGFIAAPTLSLENSQDETCGMSNGSIDLKIENGISPFSFQWSHDVSLNDSLATGLSAGNYDVTITDANTCTDILSITINEIAGPTLSLENSQDEICGNANGSIDLKIENGTSPFSFQWSHDVSLNDSLATGLSAGNYDVTITDANACTDILSITINEIAGPTLSVFSKTNSLCIDNNGEIVLALVNGTAPFTYTWSHDSNLNNNTATNLSSGNYSATVTDGNGCSDVISTSIDFDNPQITVTSSITHAICDEPNGAIQLSASGGAMLPYTYIWSHDLGLNSSLASNLLEGNYAVTVSDAQGCSTILNNIMVNNSPAPIISIASFSNTNCMIPNGSIEVQSIGGTAPLNYTWSHDPSLTGTVANGLNSGNYSITVTDGNGCTDITSISIIGIAGPSISLENSQDEICGMSNGSIDIKIVNGTAPFVFQWSHDVSLNDSLATGLSTGNYSVTITDDNSCVDILNVTIDEIAGPTLSVFSKTNSLCIDDNGEIVLAIENGTSPFSYTWSHDANLNNNTATNLSSGNYSTTVTDGNGCSDIITTTIDFDNPQINVSPNITHAICDEANGVIQLSVSGGAMQPYTYNWSHDSGLNSNLASNLSEGNYAVTVSDAQGCSTILNNIILNNSPSPILTLQSSSNSTCMSSNGSIAVQNSGGTAPFSFSWSHNASVTGAVANGLDAGSYTVTITDANACTDILNVTIEEIGGPTLILENSQPEICGNVNGSIDIKIENGTSPFSFQWNHDVSLDDSLATDLSAGNYVVTITDANACTNILNVTIEEIGGPTLILENSQPEICGNANGSIDIKIENGTSPFTFQWSHDANLNDSLATGLSTGNYFVTVTDGNACTDILNISINEIDGPALTVLSKTNSLCIDNNGSIVLSNSNGTSPFTYTWSHDLNLNNNTATNLSAGNYSATVTDGNGCTDFISTSIEFDNPLILISPNITHAVCDEANGVIQLTVSGGAMQPYTYTWSHDTNLNSNIASNLMEGIYDVTVTDASGCSSISNTITINNSPSPLLSIASFNNTDCLNPMGDIAVQTTGGTAPFTFTWNHDSNVTGANATGLSSGNYSITVTDGNGCTDITSQQLIEFDGDISITNGLECSYDSDGSLLVTLQGDPSDYNYAWSDASIPNSHIASNLSSGIYTVTVTNANACTQDFSINLTAPDQILPNISNVIPVGCGGNLGSATAIPTGGIGTYTYLWNDVNGQTSPTASNLTIGNYSILITDENGCTATEIIEIVQSSEIILTTTSVINPLCNGDENGSIQVTASQGFSSHTYLWNNNQTTPAISDLGVGEYIVTVTDGVGCTNSLSITLDEPISLEANSIIVQEPFCLGGNEGEATVEITGGTAPYQYQWNDSQNQITDTATLLVADNYLVTISDNNGCTTEAEITLSEPELLEITDIILNKPTCVGAVDGSIEVIVVGGTPDYEYILNAATPVNNNIITNIESGNYTIEIIDAKGCTTTEIFEMSDPDSILLVSENLTLVTCEGTPNGAIEILATGGTPNLSYSWSNGMNGPSIENLMEGIYNVSITDGLGCEVVDSFEIISIDIAPLDLGSRDTFICNNDILFYDFSNTDYSEFSWGRVGEGELSNASSFSAEGEETYYLHALRNDGCLVEDSIQINYTGVNLDAFFIAPTDIVVGDTIVALELTLPIPNEVNWEYDQMNIELVRQIDNQYLFYFSEVGEYDLKMTSTLGGCQNDISKRIFVYADSTEIPFVNPTVPIIINLKLFPNPNDGIFSIEVELAAEHDMVIDIFNEQSMLVDRSIFTEDDIYLKDYQLNLPTGIYYAIVQVAGARRSLTFVID